MKATTKYLRRTLSLSVTAVAVSGWLMLGLLLVAELRPQVGMLLEHCLLR